MKRKVFITLSGILLLAFVSFCLSSLVTPKKTPFGRGFWTDLRSPASLPTR